MCSQQLQFDCVQSQMLKIKTLSVNEGVWRNSNKIQKTKFNETKFPVIS
jgi:hypothetical protein